MTKPTKKIKIWSFETSQNLASCLDFVEGYKRVLTDQNINFLKSIDYTALSTQAQYGILASYEGEIIGGLLLYHPTESLPSFPFKTTTLNTQANSPYEVEIIPKTAEIVAVWNAKKVAGWGLSYVLLKAGLALSVYLGFDKTLYLTADYNIRLVEKLGLELLRVKGHDIFYHFEPNAFQARAYLHLFDMNKYSYSKKEKDAIIEIAKAEQLTTNEAVLGSFLEIEYTLALG